MERDYWEEESQRRYTELDAAIRRANERRDQKVEPHRRRYQRAVEEAQHEYDAELKPFIDQYEEWQRQRPEDDAPTSDD